MIVRNRNKSLENFLFNTKSNDNLPSLLLDEYFKIKKITIKSSQYSSITNSIKYLVNICGDKPIDDFNRLDSNNFKNYFISENRVSTGRRYQSNLFNFFKTLFDYLNIDKKNPFENIDWPKGIKKRIIFPFNEDEIKKLIRKLKEEKIFFVFSYWMYD